MVSQLSLNGPNVPPDTSPQDVQKSFVREMKHPTLRQGYVPIPIFHEGAELRQQQQPSYSYIQPSPTQNIHTDGRMPSPTTGLHCRPRSPLHGPDGSSPEPSKPCSPTSHTTEVYSAPFQQPQRRSSAGLQAGYIPIPVIHERSGGQAPPLSVQVQQHISREVPVKIEQEAFTSQQMPEKPQSPQSFHMEIDEPFPPPPPPVHFDERHHHSNGSQHNKPSMHHRSHSSNLRHYMSFIRPRRSPLHLFTKLCNSPNISPNISPNNSLNRCIHRRLSSRSPNHHSKRRISQSKYLLKQNLMTLLLEVSLLRRLAKNQPLRAQVTPGWPRCN
ncbi:hypothetical protein NHX12_022326 [Muraenolepis orangiensis]|uniref:Uncharacterized protein n=1 Tax=Muraenolepis orangiensis TaxID=630683 RepID=A0A9Q0ETB6_9TELE|nr:hypothetical protein NHX12_022326 [Muraenolepis orangiensis]